MTSFVEASRDYHQQLSHLHRQIKEKMLAIGLLEWQLSKSLFLLQDGKLISRGKGRSLRISGEYPYSFLLLQYIYDTTNVEEPDSEDNSAELLAQIPIAAPALIAKLQSLL